MRKILIALMLALAFSGCKKIEPEPTFSNHALGNFDALWTEFRDLYALTKIKNIDWNQLRDTYRSRLTEHSSADELYDVLTSMLRVTNDNHVHLLAANKAKFMGGSLNHKPAFQDSPYGNLDQDIELFRKNIQDTYMEWIHFSDVADARCFYGTLRINRTKKAGYIYIGSWHVPDKKAFSAAMDNVFKELRDVDGIIIDVRFNYGGVEENVANVAGRFLPAATPFATSQEKNGPGPNDFTSLNTWSTQPSNYNLVGKPMVLLTNGHSLSASDIFAMCVKEVVPNVIQVGETTAGGFGISVGRELPNGWQYAITGSITRDLNGISYEGRGIVPDITVTDLKSEILQHKDAQLEKGIYELTKNW